MSEDGRKFLEDFCPTLSRQCQEAAERLHNKNSVVAGDALCFRAFQIGYEAGRRDPSLAAFRSLAKHQAQAKLAWFALGFFVGGNL